MTYEAELAKHPDEFEKIKTEPEIVVSDWPRSWHDVKDFCKQYVEGFPDDDINTRKKRTRWVRTCAQRNATDEACIAEMATLMAPPEPEPEEPEPEPDKSGKSEF